MDENTVVPQTDVIVGVQKAKKAASARNAYEASATLRKLKNELAFTKKRSTLE